MTTKKLKRLLRIAKALPRPALEQEKVKLQAKAKPLGGTRAKLQQAAKALGQ
jgi:hypothetical protein